MTTLRLQQETGIAGQYSLSRIIGIWAAAALPMAFLGWVVYPLLSPDFESASLGVYFPLYC